MIRQRIIPCILVLLWIPAAALLFIKPELWFLAFAVMSISVGCGVSFMVKESENRTRFLILAMAAAVLIFLSWINVMQYAADFVLK